MLPHTRFHLKTLHHLKQNVQNETTEEFLKCALRRRARKDFYDSGDLEPFMKILAFGKDFEVQLKAAKAILNLSHGLESHFQFLDPDTKLETLVRLGKVEKPKEEIPHGFGAASRRAKKKKKDALTEAYELANKKKVVDPRDGVQTVVDFSSITKIECQTIGSCIIMNLAKSYEVQGVLLARGAMDTLVRALEEPECAWYAAAAVWNLSKHERGLTAIRNVLNVLRSMGMVNSDGASRSLELKLLLESIPIVLRQRCSHLPPVDFRLGPEGDFDLVLGTQISSTDSILFTLSQYNYDAKAREEEKKRQSESVYSRKKHSKRDTPGNSKASSRHPSKASGRSFAGGSFKNEGSQKVGESKDSHGIGDISLLTNSLAVSKLDAIEETSLASSQQEGSKSVLNVEGEGVLVKQDHNIISQPAGEAHTTEGRQPRTGGVEVSASSKSDEASGEPHQQQQQQILRSQKKQKKKKSRKKKNLEEEEDNNTN